MMTEAAPIPLMKRAKITYKDILRSIPDFDRDDRFLMNILSAAMPGGCHLWYPVSV